MNSDRCAAPANVDMVGQREIAEAEIARDLAERFGERRFGLEASDIPDKCIYTTEHPTLRPRRGRVFQVTTVPQRPFS
jgi:hypothetical protein